MSVDVQSAPGEIGYELPNAAAAAAAAALTNADTDFGYKAKLCGMDAELAQKEALKWDPELELKATKWIEKLTGESMATGFWESLKSGVILCKIINTIKPGFIDKINTKPVVLMERENIQMYLNACTKMGLEKSDLFLISDLYERKYLSAVLQNIIALAELVERRPGYNGPSIHGSGGHRRSRSVSALKPWEFDAQVKSTANSIAEAKTAVSGAEVSAAPIVPAVKAAASAAPSSSATQQLSEAQKLALAEKNISNPAVPAGKRPKIPGEDRSLFKLLKSLQPITRSDSYDIDADLRVFKNARVKTLEHLLILIGHKDYWNKLEISLVTKCCIEQALTNAFVRQRETSKEKVKEIRAIIERGDILVPDSDDIIADIEEAERERMDVDEEIVVKRDLVEKKVPEPAPVSRTPPPPPPKIVEPAPEKAPEKGATPTKPPSPEPSREKPKTPSKAAKMDLHLPLNTLNQKRSPRPKGATPAAAATPRKSSVLLRILMVFAILFVVLLLGVIGFALTLPKTPESLPELIDPLFAQLQATFAAAKRSLGLV